MSLATSCVALSDLLVSRQVGEVADDLPQLWELTLRVLDDVKVHKAPLNMYNHTTACSIYNKSKESVRKAAGIAYKSLHKVTVRACDGAAMDKTGNIVLLCVQVLLYCMCYGLPTF